MLLTFNVFRVRIALRKLSQKHIVYLKIASILINISQLALIKFEYRNHKETVVLK